MSKFAEIVSCPRMKQLDFHLVPKTLKTRVIDILGDFTYLKVLVLGGTSSGQWPLKHIVERLTKVIINAIFMSRKGPVVVKGC